MARIDVRTLQEQKIGASILSRQGTAVYPKGQPSTDQVVGGSSDLENGISDIWCICPLHSLYSFHLQQPSQRIGME